MILNSNSQEPGKTYVNDVHNDQNTTVPAQIDVSPEQKYDHSSLKGHSKSLASVQK